MAMVVANLQDLQIQVSGVTTLFLQIGAGKETGGEIVALGCNPPLFLIE